MGVVLEAHKQSKNMVMKENVDVGLDVNGSAMDCPGLESNGRDEEGDKYHREMVSRSKKEASQMDENIWRLLPGHLIERVLPWLLVPNIGRSQLLCRSWNSMVKSRLFSDCYSDACVLVEREPWFLVFSKKTEYLGFDYDILENKWMSFPFSFLPMECRAVSLYT